MSPGVYTISRLSVGLIWFYHGLVPKLIFASEQETQMNDILLPFLSRGQAIWLSGIGEILFAAAYLFFWRNRALNWPGLVFAPAVTLALLFTLPGLFTHAFNPFSINLSLLEAL